jgi:hypothetical protein
MIGPSNLELTMETKEDVTGLPQPMQRKEKKSIVIVRM